MPGSFSEHRLIWLTWKLHLHRTQLICDPHLECIDLSDRDCRGIDLSSSTLQQRQRRLRGRGQPKQLKHSSTAQREVAEALARPSRNLQRGSPSEICSLPFNQISAVRERIANLHMGDVFLTSRSNNCRMSEILKHVQGMSANISSTYLRGAVVELLLGSSILRLQQLQQMQGFICRQGTTCYCSLIESVSIYKGIMPSRDS